MNIELEQYIDRVFRFALSLTNDQHLAEDLTQECFLKAQQRITQLRSETVVRPWLFQILVNLWKDHLKRKPVVRLSNDSLDTACRTLGPESLQIQNEEYKKILELMQTLPSQQRSVLFLKVVEECSNSEIATLLGKSENAVKANLSIARRTMREKIQEMQSK